MCWKFRGILLKCRQPAIECTKKTPHPTQKPEELLRKLILVSSNVEDTILDPFCGSGTAPVCAPQLKRKWLACDLSPEYLDWAANRIELVEEWSIEKWIKYDLENQKRRNSIFKSRAPSIQI